MADRVRFLGKVAREHVPALMRSADVVVSVPWYEPFGIVPLEAMACGVPVVASAVGGHLDTVVPGVTGLLVPPREPYALGRALRRLLGRRPARRRTVPPPPSGRDRRYDWDKIADQTAAVYAEVISSRVSAWRKGGARSYPGVA